MILNYPIILMPDQNSTVIALFPDVPEAMTVGKDSDSAVEQAQDALVVALSGYIDEQRDIPRPSNPEPGQRTIPLPPHVVMKIAIYQAMRDKGFAQAELAQCIGVDRGQIHQILTLDRHTNFSHLIRALKCLGKEVLIDIRDAA